MGKLKFISIVGARPNFIKVAPLHRAFLESHHPIESKIIHTGQHFDARMSHVFFEELELPVPEYYLGVGQGTHSEMTARIMLELEPILFKEKPDVLIVVGDVTSTLASALVSQRLNIPIAHVEAGLRSFDASMPEEINRKLTDQISDYLFVTEESGIHNLIKENIEINKIHWVGNCMIDSLVYYHDKTIDQSKLTSYGLQPKDYILMTMHRPSNVDTEEGLIKIISILQSVCNTTKVLFPVHPRTVNRLQDLKLMEKLNSIDGLICTEPLPYLEFITLMRYSMALLTDSGGVQEETTYLGIPCITFRKSTERPVTISMGTNILMNDLNVENTIKEVRQILNGIRKPSTIPPLWDGNAAKRIRDILVQALD